MHQQTKEKKIQRNANRFALVAVKMGLKLLLRVSKAGQVLSLANILVIYYAHIYV